MNGDKVYLRADVQIEPLVDQWYAWSHLIPPATAARNLKERYLRIMNSFIESPEIHVEACKNPAMLGGPFIAYPAERVPDIVQLRDTLLKRRHYMIDLADALAELDGFLTKQATGYSLEPLYAGVPEILRGYVELVYNLKGQSDFRLLEPLLYQSTYYCPESETIAMSITSGDERPFVLSTPRLDDRNSLNVQMAFSDPRLDVLARARRAGLEPLQLNELLQLQPKDEAFAAGLVTLSPPAAYLPYTGSGVRWRYFGHACILVETADLAILVDPVISYEYRTTIPRYTYLNLPARLDYIMITHNHQDHILLETLLQLRHLADTVIVPRGGCGNLQDPSLKLTLEHCGFRRVVELSTFQEIELPNGSIMGIPFLGEHGDLDIASKLAYLVRLGSHSLLFAADSRNVEPRVYEHVSQTVGDVDVLFLGMECDGAPMSWLYGPLITSRVERSKDQSRRLAGSDCNQAIRMIEDLACKEVYVYAMGQEPWLNHIMSIKYSALSRPIVESDRLISLCLERGIACERLFGEKEILLN